MSALGDHHLRIKGRGETFASAPDPGQHAESVRSWLAALGGAEHLSLLVGSGLGLGLASRVKAKGLSMDPVTFSGPDAAAIDAHANTSAKNAGGGSSNIEDQLRSALQLLAGRDVVDPDGSETTALRDQIEEILTDFATQGLLAEASIRQKLDAETPEGRRAVQLLVAFLLAFASRPPSRERLNIFTTNYDRLIEYGADLGGLRVLDRFVGSVEPFFRSSRLELDVHYNPPGLRGEPRYLEGVVRLSKLHGSLDWRFGGGRLRRIPLAFGQPDPQLKDAALERLMIYPNAAKDVQTLLFPYADLFRDFSAALCRPNGVLVTYGYGFGDEHVNRVLRDMLTLRSTHLLVMAHGDPEGRIEGFLERIAEEQQSLLFGSHFGDLGSLVDHYLPHPGSETLLASEAGRRRALASDGDGAAGEGGVS